MRYILRVDCCQASRTNLPSPGKSSCPVYNTPVRRTEYLNQYLFVRNGAMNRMNLVFAFSLFCVATPTWPQFQRQETMFMPSLEPQRRSRLTFGHLMISPWASPSFITINVTQFQDFMSTNNLRKKKAFHPSFTLFGSATNHYLFPMVLMMSNWHERTGSN